MVLVVPLTDLTPLVSLLRQLLKYLCLLLLNKAPLFHLYGAHLPLICELDWVFCFVFLIFDVPGLPLQRGWFLLTWLSVPCSAHPWPFPDHVAT